MKFIIFPYICSAMSRLIDIHTHFPTGRHIEPQGVGIHPWRAADEALPRKEKYAAADLVGEIGLDFACDVERSKQEEVFRAQLSIAEELQKPIVLHCVRAFEPTMKILAEYDLRAVIFHGFIGSVQQAERAIEKGYFLSFGANTSRSPKTIEALRNTPLDKIFVESDESKKNIEEIYSEIATLKGCKQGLLEQAILENYNNIFE